MRSALLFLLPLLAFPAFGQPDPYPHIRITAITIEPAQPTAQDTLTITYRFHGQTCGHTRDWHVERRPLTHWLHVNVTQPATATCTTDKPRSRISRMRIGPLPKGHYQVLMDGNHKAIGHYMRYTGPPVLFDVR